MGKYELSKEQAMRFIEESLDAYIADYGANHNGEGTSESQRDAMRECFLIDTQFPQVGKWAMRQPHDDLAAHYADLWRFAQYAKQLITALRANAGLHEEAAGYMQRTADANEEIARLYAVRLASIKEARKRGAATKYARSPAHAAMTEIRKEFDRWQAAATHYANDADFAKKLHSKYATTIRNEGSIKNACARWHKENKSSC